MCGGVPLRDVGPVALTVEDDPVEPEILADRLDVAHGLVGCVRGQPRRVEPCLLRAGPREPLRDLDRRVRIGRQLVVGRGSGAFDDLGAADAARIEDDDVVRRPKTLRQRSHQRVRGDQPAAAGPADGDDQRAAAFPSAGRWAYSMTAVAPRGSSRA